MTKATLDFIAKTLTENGINYEFMEWTTDVIYPYFTGEYIEEESLTEDGYQGATFILNGFTRGTYKDLEDAKEKIENMFNTTAILNDVGVAILYSSSLVIPTNDDELKRIQINLSVKEWKGNN